MLVTLHPPFHNVSVQSLSFSKLRKYSCKNKMLWSYLPQLPEAIHYGLNRPEENVSNPLFQGQLMF